MGFSRPEHWSSLSLLQGIFLTQESNPGLPHCRWILYQLSYQGSPNQRQIHERSQITPCLSLSRRCSAPPALCLLPAPPTLRREQHSGFRKHCRWAGAVGSHPHPPRAPRARDPMLGTFLWVSSATRRPEKAGEDSGQGRGRGMAGVRA